MIEKTINIENILKLKLHISLETLFDINSRFANISIDNFEFNNNCDFEIFYNQYYDDIEQIIKNIPQGNTMYPFRNSLYNVSESKNNIFAYAPEQKYACEHVIIRENNKISIFCKGDSNSKVLIRVITELMIRKLLERKFFPLHASSIMVDDKAELFFGNKNSGKSTALFSNVVLNNAYPIANDITFLGRENGIWTAFGIPYDVTFDETLFSQIGLKKNITNNRKGGYGSDKIRYSISEFADVFNIDWVWKAPISVINKVSLCKERNFVETSINPKLALYYLELYGKDKNFSFDDFLKVNNLFPIFDYERLSKEVEFNKMEGNILKYQLRR